MNAIVQKLLHESNVEAAMLEMGKAARAAARGLAAAPRELKDETLRIAAAEIRRHTPVIVEENKRDLEAAESAGRPGSYLDRLMLDPDRIEGIARGLEAIADLADPVGSIIAEWKRPNGLAISRVRVPIGVIGIIYESRPNVTADAGALCLKSGNAAILRGGSDSHHSSLAILTCLAHGLRQTGLPEDAIQLVATVDRDAVGHMLRGLEGAIDVIVPRGGKSLVARVQEEARVPVFAHLEGICHTYVDRGADIDMAVEIVLNAKLRRTGVCGATEALLVDKNAHDDYVSPLVKALLDAGCEVRGDAAAQAVDERVVAASDKDWGTEFLDAIIAVKAVDGVDEAIRHIARHGSQHTDCIVTECIGTAERFLTHVDSAIVMHNASTQFADGGEFGMGAEIGIATGRLHARGPVGLEQLTTFKYVVRGSGQVRPK
ncbi:MAG: gamma-glutamyl-phosphate reductase [Alphaproteobacteria bacterium BRH_c36]|nr:MAG: gamma-glutamyl-phosphate reductase [Alphaproteobacteria bacterium BRH_c36]